MKVYETFKPALVSSPAYPTELLADYSNMLPSKMMHGQKVSPI